MKQPDSLNVGTKMDVVRYRLNVAREDLDAANLTFEAWQYRAAIIEHITVSFTLFVRYLLKKVLLLNDIKIHSATLIRIMCSLRFFLVNLEEELLKQRKSVMQAIVTLSILLPKR